MSRSTFIPVAPVYRDPARVVASPSRRIRVVLGEGARVKLADGRILPASSLPDRAILGKARRTLAEIVPRMRIPAWVGEHRVMQRFVETSQTQEIPPCD